MVGRSVVALRLSEGKGVVVVESRVCWSGLFPEGGVLRYVSAGYGVLRPPWKLTFEMAILDRYRAK